MNRAVLTIFLFAALASATFAGDTMTTMERPHPYVGLWVTRDGHVRHELLANGRYDEARGHRKSAYQGRYSVTGDHIDYWDDTGFTADGDFIDGVLYHGGMILYRK
ncbi:Atu4866 domain-containing protein [Rhizobium sp. LjRoot98]|uniref:Atu4866 domain-containing protein n=1 Tax=unclassified Rhizobium TaxID=2613769 RepID=UPI000B0CF2DB|nr:MULTISPECIES: Atu4866 domain-containing protein [unclassified Rhizobium]